KKWGDAAGAALMGYATRNQTKSSSGEARPTSYQERRVAAYGNLGKAIGKGKDPLKEKAEKKKKGPTKDSLMKRLRELAQENYDRNA
ncbi:unnamed protein product, partial [marine sediment metagenome]